MELNDIIDAILFKCVEARGYYQDIGVLADSVAGRVLTESEKDDIEGKIEDSGLMTGTGQMLLESFPAKQSSPQIPDAYMVPLLPGLLNFSRLPLALPKLNIYLLHFGKYADRLLK